MNLLKALHFHKNPYYIGPFPPNSAPGSCLRMYQGPGEVVQ